MAEENPYEYNPGRAGLTYSHDWEHGGEPRTPFNVFLFIRVNSQYYPARMRIFADRLEIESHFLEAPLILNKADAIQALTIKRNKLLIKSPGFGDYSFTYQRDADDRDLQRARLSLWASGFPSESPQAAYKAVSAMTIANGSRLSW